jgi:hypothetical protein
VTAALNASQLAREIDLRQQSLFRYNQRCQYIDSAQELCQRNLAIAYLFGGRTDDAIRLYETGLENG